MTLQDRLVKELRLGDISTIEAANAFMPRFIADYEELDLMFAWRELRRVTTILTLHYERKLCLLADTPENRRLIDKYLEIFQFPDGRIESRIESKSLPYSLECARGDKVSGAAGERCGGASLGQGVDAVQAHFPPSRRTVRRLASRH